MAKRKQQDATPRSRTAGETGKAGKKKKSSDTAQSLRRRIDRLDRQLLELINERGEAVQTLAELGKVKTAVAEELVHEPEEVRRAVCRNKGPLSDRCVRAVFRELFSGCRELILPLRVAYLGPEYSYSHLAAVHRFGDSAELLPVATIAAVFESVNRGDVQFGLVPLENSTDGRITDTLDMFARMPVRISGEVQLRIHHHLLGKCPREQVNEVRSKPQALSQCRNWLSSHLPAARIVETTSTTAAAEAAAQGSGVAAIASQQAGVNYGLDILVARIEDNPKNVTRFAVIGHTSALRTGQDITSLMFQLTHRPGALAEATAIFKRNRLNLTWIESFPLPGSSNEYLFFVELEGYETDLRVRRAIASLRGKTERLEILGSYERTEPVD